ncbi:type I-E CRISPR-associated protein Cas6/Cse3/CasE [Streptomyces sp. XD-27]|uniref:type I-E CRISPR-associated protein Cas6/Cse3/CasE n=1 Tax=Streptomyces sp. XD-27 TaxID=3062779 RepID=UPI0026F455F0|nr:type I-E CRISPR-associated protein Cas6/Cse3/CasE [Streptomyces sp. XD-27]WKX72145.1 type I-E CRISPR-associated protein Cas6/Cse3/CasE [Streptomyces sp. XD-27]
MLDLDARHPLAQRAVVDPRLMHRTVMSGFYGWAEPDGPDPRAQMGILTAWALDPRTNTVRVVVQSRVQPDWTSLPSRALAREATLLPVDMRVHRGDVLSFRTVVSPVRDRELWQDTPQGRRPTRLRVADTTARYAREWFAERLQPACGAPVGRDGVRRIGATGDPLAMTVRMLPKLTLGDCHRGRALARAEIRGTLTVTDPAAFTHALEAGIGPGRAYGAGLLLVRRRDGAPGAHGALA